MRIEWRTVAALEPRKSKGIGEIDIRVDFHPFGVVLETPIGCRFRSPFGRKVFDNHFGVISAEIHYDHWPKDVAVVLAEDVLIQKALGIWFILSETFTQCKAGRLNEFAVRCIGTNDKQAQNVESARYHAVHIGRMLDEKLLIQLTRIRFCRLLFIVGRVVQLGFDSPSQMHDIISSRIIIPLTDYQSIDEPIAFAELLQIINYVIVSNHFAFHCAFEQWFASIDPIQYGFFYAILTVEQATRFLHWQIDYSQAICSANHWFI